MAPAKIVHYDSEIDVKDVDDGVSNKWRWDWLNHSFKLDLGVVTVDYSLREHIRKLDKAGKATCTLCDTDISYGGKGKSRIVTHCTSDTHKKALRLVQTNFNIKEQFTSAGRDPPVCYGFPSGSQPPPPPPLPSKPRVVHVSNRVANSEAKLIGFMAEHRLNFQLAQPIIDLARSLAADRPALSQLNMSDTAASYKLKYGVAKTMTDSLHDTLKTSFYSLNVDEATSENKHKVLSVLASYFCKIIRRIKVSHLTSLKLERVDADTVFKALKEYWDTNNLPYENLISVLMDSCSVMRGGNTGVEVKLHTVAPHLLNIDGDTVHHVHGAGKAFSEAFNQYLEQLFTDICTDFTFCTDYTNHLEAICEILRIRYTKPQRCLPTRFLNNYDLVIDFLRLLDALTIFYASFLPVADKIKHEDIIEKIFADHKLSEPARKRLRSIMYLLSKKGERQKGEKTLKRRATTLKALFDQRRKTLLTLDFYAAVLAELKEFAVLFQSREPLIHILHDRLVRLVFGFMALFMKPEKLDGLTPKMLVALKPKLEDPILSKSLVMKPREIFLGKAEVEVSNAKKSDVVVEDFCQQALQAYINGAVKLLKNMPLDNKVLKYSSSLDPAKRKRTKTLKHLKKLPALVENVEVDTTEYNKDCRRYCADINLPDNWDQGADAWWAMIEESKQYPALSTMSLALLTCFHGPAVESNFNIMKMLMRNETSSMEVETFSAYETVKYELRETASFKPGKKPARGNQAIDYYHIENFREDPPNPKLVANMKGAWLMNDKRKKAVIQERLERAQSLQLSNEKPTPKRKAQEEALAASKKMKCEKLTALAKRAKEKNELAARRLKEKEMKSAKLKKGYRRILDID